MTKSHICPKCGAEIVETDRGYTTGCLHEPIEQRTRVHCEPTPSILLALEEARLEDDDYPEGYNYG
jgi:hypothetical protein